MTPEMLSLSNSPGIFIGVMLVKILVVFTVVMLSVAYATWWERKIIGHMQTRLGPMRTGWHGLLQPFADGIKLFFKEEIIPTHATIVPFLLAPAMILVPALITVAVIPFGPDLHIGNFLIPQQITDLNIGVLYILAFAGLGIYGIVLAGWASNSKYSLLGGVRASAQMISYELAAGLTIIAVFMLSETLSLREIVALQQEPLWGDLLLCPELVRVHPAAGFRAFRHNRTGRDQPDSLRHARSGERAGLRFLYRIFLDEVCTLLHGGIRQHDRHRGDYRYAVPRWLERAAQLGTLQYDPRFRLAAGEGLFPDVLFHVAACDLPPRPL